MLCTAMGAWWIDAQWHIVAEDSIEKLCLHLHGAATEFVMAFCQE